MDTPLTQSNAQTALPKVFPPIPAEKEERKQAVQRVGNFNILRVDLSASSETMAQVAEAQSKIDCSPQEQLIALHKKAHAMLSAIDKHESSSKKKGLRFSEETQRKKAKVEAFLKQIQEFAKQKGVSVTEKIEIKAGQNSQQQVRISAESLAHHNRSKTVTDAQTNKECFLKTGLTNEQKLLVAQKLGIVLKKLSDVDKAIGDRSVFADSSVAKAVRDELESLRILEYKTLQSVTSKLEFIHKDFSRFSAELKKQYVLVEQRKELMAQMEELIRDFPEEEIAKIPSDISEAVSLVESKAQLLSRYAQAVEDLAAVNKLIQATQRQASENKEILAALKAQAEANATATDANRATGH